MGRINPLEETTKKTTSSKTTKAVKDDTKEKIGQKSTKIKLDAGYDATTVNVQFEKVKTSKRPNYDALSDEVKKNHQLAMNFDSKIISYSSPIDGADTFCFPLMYHAVMIKYLNCHAIEVIEAKFKDLKASLNVEIDQDKLDKYDIIYNSLLGYLRDLEKGVSEKKRLISMVSDSLKNKYIDDDALFDMLETYRKILKVFEIVFSDTNLKYDNRWIESEINKPEFITKLMSSSAGIDFTLLKNKRTHIYVRTLPSCLRLFYETYKSKFNVELEIDGAKLSISKQRPTHVLAAGNEKLEISKLPQDFMYLITEIFQR